MPPAERHLIWFLRLSAVMFFCAAPFVFVPTAWMRPIAAWYGLELPDAPLLEYLIRSVSAGYAMLGAMYWWISRDVGRYLPLLWFNAMASLVYDAVVIGIGVMVPLPALWTISEAVSMTIWTLTMMWLLWRLQGEYQR
ncbi:MAG TPA: hypothetical protein VFE62_07405 [Gemmataceae bacterium]|nr:hypothetical protein [Gemmataceae bacterium]